MIFYSQVTSYEYRISEKRMTNCCQTTLTANKTVSSLRDQVKHGGTIQLQIIQIASTMI